MVVVRRGRVGNNDDVVVVAFDVFVVGRLSSIRGRVEFVVAVATTTTTTPTPTTATTITVVKLEWCYDNG